MTRQGEAANEIERPRSVGELIGATFALYRRFPWLFLVLAGAVMVPYEVILLLATGAGANARGGLSFPASMLINLVYLALVLPLISALHVHAVQDVRDGKRPEVPAVTKRSLRVLPVVSAAVVVSFLGATAALLALIVPGILLYVRWSVAAPAAALEDGGWADALRRSRRLTENNYGHVFGLLLLVFTIGGVPGFALSKVLGHTETTVVSFLAETVLTVIVASFSALATAFLYFDLKSRISDKTVDSVDAITPAPRDGGRAPGWYIDPSNPRRMRYWTGDGASGWSAHTAKTPKTMRREWQQQHAAEARPTGTASEGHTAHSLDPDVYTDESRPPGWYVDPDQPWRMRYWHAGEHRAWSKETAKTPEKAQAEWRDLRWRR